MVSERDMTNNDPSLAPVDILELPNPCVCHTASGLRRLVAKAPAECAAGPDATLPGLRRKVVFRTAGHIFWWVKGSGRCNARRRLFISFFTIANTHYAIDAAMALNNVRVQRAWFPHMWGLRLLVYPHHDAEKSLPVV